MKHEPTKEQLDYLSVLRHAVKQEPAEPAWVEAIEWEAVFRLSFPQSQAALVYHYCTGHGIPVPESVRENARLSYEQNLHRELLMDHERGVIYRWFDENGIPHCSLKGINLKTLYPDAGLRYSSDNDILIDGSRSAEVRDYMKARGYTVTEYNEDDKHDSYVKNPSYHFEMHRALTELYEKSEYADYFNHIFPHLIRTDESGFLYEMTPEDEYIFILGHMHHHYSRSGSGLRGLVDIYLFTQKHPGLKDSQSLNDRLKRYGLLDFETLARTLAYKIMEEEAPDLTAKEKEMLSFMFVSGSHGSVEGQYRNYVNRSSGSGKRAKLSYVLHKLAPDTEYMRFKYPFIYKTKIFIPFYMVWRALHCLFTGKLFRYFRAMKDDE